MKRNFLLLVMMCLAFLGKVNLNVLNAQTTVTIGDGSAAEMYSPPIDIYYANGFSQQIFPASSLGIPSGSVISKIAFKHSGGSSPTRTWSIYMQNSETGVFVYPEYTVSAKPVESSDKVYSGTFTVPSEENVWVPFDLTEPFTYEGGDLILTVIDNTGAKGGDHWWINSYGFGHSIHGGKSSAYNEGANYSFNQRYDYTSDIQLTFAAAGEGGETPDPEDPVTTIQAPANLAVQNGNNIFIEKDRDLVLTWDAVDGATGYKVYKNDEFVEETPKTTFTVSANNVTYSTDPIIYSVSAKNDTEESKKSQISIIVTGYGNINGIVTNGKTALAGITIELSGINEFGTYTYPQITTNENGFFNKDILVGTYTLTISHEDYEYLEWSGITPTYNSDINLGEIKLTAKPATFKGTVDTDWNTPENWSIDEVPFGVDVIIKAPTVISSNANVSNLNILDGASVTVDNRGILTITNYIYNNGDLIINDGAQLFQNNEDINATFNMSIISPEQWESNYQKGWQFISSPFVDATVASFIPSEGEYDLYKYDGTQDLEWVNHKGENSGGSGESGDTFYYDFNDASVDDWTKIDADDDGQNWGVTSNGIYAGYDGSVGLYSSCYQNKPLFPDNYFVTNNAYAITETSVLSFFHRESDGTYNQENFGVVVSENRTDWEVVWSKRYASNETHADGVWVEENVSLATYAGKTVYLGFRHYDCDGNSANGIRIDNVKLYVSEGGNSASGTSSFEDKFAQGVGYLASYETAATVALNGNLYNKDNFTFKVSYNAEKDLANFHLLGNPFTFNMDWSKITAKGLVDGYAVVNNEGGYDYLTSGTINVGDGFFVKANAENPSLSYNHSYVAPVLRGSEKANSINVIASGKAGKDNVVVNFAGQAEGFNKLQNFNDAIATVYVTENGKNYGIANVDENTTEVALNFDAKEMGNYTISLDINGEFETVTLVDRFTGVETNMLLEDEYTFTAASNDNVNRFVIKLDNGQEPTANSQFVYQSGEELILSIEGSVQIVDMLGRVVYSNEHANGDNRINVAEFNDAAYVVRVVNEEGVKVQKVVIY